MANGSSDKPLAVPILLACTVLAIGLIAYIKLAPADVVPREVLKEQQIGGEPVHLLTPYYADNELKFRSERADTPRDVDPAVFAINQYLRSVNFVPMKALLKSSVIANGTASLDFTSAFDTSYGTDDESTVINGILAVMGQFKEVSRVKFLVEGKPIDTLGNMDLVDPLEVIRLPHLESAESAQTPARF